MWDLKKTLDTIAGIRKREALGLPPFHMAPEERAKWEPVITHIRESMAATRAEQAKRGPWKPTPPPGED